MIDPPTASDAAIATGAVSRAVRWALAQPGMTTHRLRWIDCRYHCHWSFDLSRMDSPEIYPILVSALSRALAPEADEIRRISGRWAIVAVSRSVLRLAKRVSQVLGEAKNGFLVPVLPPDVPDDLLRGSNVIAFADVINTGHTIGSTIERFRKLGCTVRKALSIVEARDFLGVPGVPTVSLYRTRLDRCRERTCIEPAESAQSIPLGPTVPQETAWSVTAFYQHSKNARNLVQVLAAAAREDARAVQSGVGQEEAFGCEAPHPGSWFPRHKVMKRVHYSHFINTWPLLYHKGSYGLIREHLAEKFRTIGVPPPAAIVYPYLRINSRHGRELRASAEAFAGMVRDEMGLQSVPLLPHPVTRHRGGDIEGVPTGHRVLVVLAAASKGDTILNSIRSLLKSGISRVDVLVMLNRLNRHVESRIVEELNRSGGRLISQYELRLPVLIEGHDHCERCRFKRMVLEVARDRRLGPWMRPYVLELRRRISMGARRCRPYQGAILDFTSIDRVGDISPSLWQVLSEQAYWAAQAEGRRFELEEFERLSGSRADSGSKLLRNLVRGLPKEAHSDPTVSRALLNYLHRKVTCPGVQRWEEIGKALFEKGFTTWCGSFLEWVANLKAPLVATARPGVSSTQRRRIEARHERVWGFVAFCLYMYLSACEGEEGGVSEERRIEVLAGIRHAARNCAENGEDLEAAFDDICRHLNQDGCSPSGETFLPGPPTWDPGSGDEDGLELV